MTIKISRIVICIMLAVSYTVSAQNFQDYKTNHKHFQKFIHKDLDSASYYLEKLVVKKKMDDSLPAYFYHQDAGQYFFVIHQMDSSQYHYQRAYDISSSLNEPILAIDSDMWLANHEYFEGKNARVLRHWHRILSKSREENYIEGMATAFYSFASLEMDIHNKYNSLLKVDSLYRAHDTISKVLANTYAQIGQIYMESNSNDALALEFINQALEVSEKVAYEPGIFNATGLLGEMALKEKDYDKARVYVQNLWQQGLDQKNELIRARALLKLAQIGVLSGDMDDVAAQLDQCAEIFTRHNEKAVLARVNLIWAEMLLKKKEMKKALPHLEKAIKYPVSGDTVEFNIDLMKAQTTYYELMGDFKMAYHFHKVNEEFVASVEQTRNQKAFILSQQQRIRQKNEEVIESLKAQNRASEHQKELQEIVFFCIAIVLLLLSSALFYRYQNKQKTNKKLRELDTLKSNFFTNISHEFRTPLTLISVPIQEVLSESVLPADKRSHLELALKNTKRLLFLVDQLLNLSKIDSGHLKLELEEGDALQYIGAWSESFSYLAKQKKIDFEIRTEKSNEKVWFDKDALEKIVVNLLGNAIKYTPRYGKVEASAFLKGNTLHFQIGNSGKGIDTSQLQTIFKRFYQVDEEKEGSGIGLSLTKELVELHKGSIRVKSDPGSWTTFDVSLCVDKDSFKNPILKSHSSESRGLVPFTLNGEKMKEDPQKENGLPILLIVEDHPDVRKLLKNTFKSKYQVVTAGNGEDGRIKALEYIPDIIISDVMMPILDGIALTRFLKEDERTSHIPILLLTAKAGDDNTITGIDVGADDYMTKPFSQQILRSKVKNLIALRKKLQTRYSREIILKPKDIAVTPADERFLNKVQAILDARLTASDFSVEDFSNSVDMSRMQLHRKLKALTGLSASVFIRSQRLKLARSILERSDCSISEVGYQVGFNDPSYFAKCFKETYGMTPTLFSSKTSPS